MTSNKRVLSIEHAGGVLTSYEPVVSELTRGQAVERGQEIGTAIAGHCASLCLHFGVRVEGLYASPLAWLGGVERAVLLPTRRNGGESARAPAHGRESRIRVNPRNPVGERSSPPPAKGRAPRFDFSNQLRVS